MAKSYSQVQKQIAKLQREADAIKKKEVGGVIERIKSAIAHYELTPDDLFGEQKSKRSAGRKAGGKTAAKASLTGRKVPVKYRDENGNTWSARGSQPRWLVAALAGGRKLEDFQVTTH